jgi:hypothetical protein
MKKLSQLTVRPDEERSFVLHIEDEEGRALDLAVSAEQLDVIADSLDGLLSENEEQVFAADDGEIYQKPLG